MSLVAADDRRDPNHYTHSLGHANLYGAQSRQIDLAMAGSVLAAVASLIVVHLLRKQLLEGLTAGSVKYDLVAPATPPKGMSRP